MGKRDEEMNGMPTFTQWLTGQEHRDDGTGRLARLWRDVTPGRISTPTSVLRTLQKIADDGQAPRDEREQAVAAAVAVGPAVAEYNQARTASPAAPPDGDSPDADLAAHREGIRDAAAAVLTAVREPGQLPWMPGGTGTVSPVPEAGRQPGMTPHESAVVIGQLARNEKLITRVLEGQRGILALLGVLAAQAGSGEALAMLGELGISVPGDGDAGDLLAIADGAQ